MGPSGLIDDIVIILSLRLAQPAMLGDVYEGVQRLMGKGFPKEYTKDNLHDALLRLEDASVVKAYYRRRYMLTDRGDKLVSQFEMGPQMDARRMFLLKDTRKLTLRQRSDTRD